MENFIYSVDATFPIFLVMVIGYILKQIGMLNDNFVTVANRFNFKVTLPFMLFRDISGVDIRAVFDIRYVLFCALVSTACFWIIWGGVKLFLKDQSMRGAFVQASFRSSAAVMGLAFIQNMYGSSAMGPLMIVSAVPLYNIFSVIVLTFEGAHSGEVDPKQKIKAACINIAKNPIILGILTGLIVGLLGIDFPVIVDKTVNSVAQMATPLALITIGAGLLHSFLPETAEKIVNQLNTTLRDYDDLDKFGLYESGSRVTDTPEILFARLDAKEVMPKVEEIKAAQKAEFEAEQKKLAGETETAEEAEESAIDIEPKAEIEYDDFMKMQFQVGEIIACEAVPKSKKLLCSQVKIGSQVKQIVSGIRKHYTPEEMVGKKVMVLVNLKPAKLAGVVSEGMLLCAEDENGELALMVPEKKMPSGAEIC